MPSYDHRATQLVLRCREVTVLLVIYLFNSSFVTDPEPEAGLGSFYTVFPSKPNCLERRFFHVLGHLCSVSLDYVKIEPRLFLFILIRCSLRGQLFF